MKIGKITRVPNLIPYITVVDEATVTSTSVLPDRHVGSQFTDMKVHEIPLHGIRYSKREYITEEMIEYMKHSSINHIDMMMDRFTRKMEDDVRRMAAKGIDIFICPPKMSTGSAKLHLIPSDITPFGHRAYQFDYTFQIKEDDMYKYHFMDGVTDKAIDECLVIAKQRIDRKIEQIVNKYRNRGLSRPF